MRTYLLREKRIFGGNRMKRLRKPLKFTIITFAIVFVLVFASVKVCAVESVSKGTSLEQMSTTIDII